VDAAQDRGALMLLEKNVMGEAEAELDESNGDDSKTEDLMGAAYILGLGAC
jgi:hypothetical protein